MKTAKTPKKSEQWVHIIHAHECVDASLNFKLYKTEREKERKEEGEEEKKTMFLYLHPVSVRHSYHRPYRDPEHRDLPESP